MFTSGYVQILGDVVYWGLSDGRPYDLRRICLGPYAGPLEVAQSVGYYGA